MSSRIIKVGFDKVKKVDIGGNKPLVFIGGPCAIESNDHALYMAEKISKVCEKLKISWIYKSSYDKDCQKGEPIVNTPDQAIKCFLKTNIDILTIGNFFIRKNNI